MTTSDDRLKETLLTACRILDREGVMDELGHFSVRVPGEDRVWMNGKVSPGQAREEDLVLLDLKGRRLEGRLDPAKESVLHLGIYLARPDVGAVAHTHSPTIVSLSAAGKALRAMENLGATAFGGEVPQFRERGLIDTVDIAARMAETLGSARVLVLTGHGDVVVGTTIEEACICALWAEKAARLQVQSMLLGDPEWYTGEETGKVREQVTAGRAFERAWNYYTWRLRSE